MEGRVPQSQWRLHLFLNIIITIILLFLLSNKCCYTTILCCYMFVPELRLLKS